MLNILGRPIQLMQYYTLRGNYLQGCQLECILFIIKRVFSQNI
jgi:hypothetical protein